MNLIKLTHKELSVFGINDGLNGCSQDADAILVKYAAFVELDTTIECGLPTKCEENAVRTFLLNDALDEVGLHRQEVYLVGNALRGLYRRNVGIDEYRLHSLLAKRLQSLRTTIVEFTCLTYL